MISTVAETDRAHLVFAQNLPEHYLEDKFGPQRQYSVEKRERTVENWVPAMQSVLAEEERRRGCVKEVTCH